MTAFVTMLDGPALAHLRRALTAEARRCRADGLRLPPALAELSTQLAATDGQRRTSIDDSHDVGDARIMTALTALAVTYDEAARLLRVSERTVRRLVSSGALSAVRVGSAPRIRVEDLRQYLDAQAGTA